MAVALNLDWSFGTKQITGTVTDSFDAWGANLTADLATNLLPVGAGKFTMTIPPGTGSPLYTPGGYGYASITNNESGTVTFAGALADGAKFSETEPLSKDGVAPLYATPYNKSGLLIGWIDFSNSVPTGTVTWIKPATNFPATYPEGFVNTVDVTGSAYVPSTPALTLSNGTLTIADADVAGLPLVFNVAVSNNNAIAKLSGSPTNKLSGSITASTDVISITFRPTGLGSTSDKTATGVVLQSGASAAGAFTGTTNTGSIDLR